MEIIESVRRDEIPQEGLHAYRKGAMWAQLADRAVKEYENHTVVVVKVADMDELHKMRNGMADRLRKAGFLFHPVVVEESDGLRVFVQLEEREKKEDPGLSVLGPVNGRRRRHARVGT